MTQNQVYGRKFKFNVKSHGSSWYNSHLCRNVVSIGTGFLKFKGLKYVFHPIIFNIEENIIRILNLVNNIQ